MKVAEMRKRGVLPERAGLARLQFGYDGCSRRPPFRQRDRIVLPDTPRAELFPLQKGRQFLFQHQRPAFGDEIWFGGTDESPFLVQLTDEAFLIFEAEGEEEFYKELKPEVIAIFEKELKISAKRQGDIFALPIPYSWEDAGRFALFFLGLDFWCGASFVGKPKANKVRRRSIFGTRHRLTGKHMDFREKFIEPENLVFAEGTVEAPNHSSMKLQGIHLLAQTANLADPERAE